MSKVETSENGLFSASFLFTEDFTGFQGHFPDNKILPGVCQIQCVLNLFEQLRKKRIILKEVIMAKFLSPVSPGDKLTCSSSITDRPDGSHILKASLTSEGKKIADMKIKVGFGRELNE